MAKVYSVLSDVREELNVPKDQYNAFGKYKFRNLESINAALKPLCKKYKCCYYMTDSVVLIGERYYTQATVTFYVDGCEETVTSVAYAREENEKKGMDAAQISGLASSYARKYAICGLFAVDSGEEVDALDNRPSETAPKTRTATRTTTTRRTQQTTTQKASESVTEETLQNKVLEFANLRGKTVDDVIKALNITPAMKKLGVTAEQIEYTDNQRVAAVGIVTSWLTQVKKEG